MRRRGSGVDCCLLTNWEGEGDGGLLNVEDSKGEENESWLKGRELTVLATKEQSILAVEMPFLQTGCKTSFKNSAEKL